MDRAAKTVQLHQDPPAPRTVSIGVPGSTMRCFPGSFILKPPDVSALHEALAGRNRLLWESGEGQTFAVIRLVICVPEERRCPCIRPEPSGTYFLWVEAEVFSLQLATSLGTSGMGP